MTEFDLQRGKEFYPIYKNITTAIVFLLCAHLTVKYISSIPPKVPDPSTYDRVFSGKDYRGRNMLDWDLDGKVDQINYDDNEPGVAWVRLSSRNRGCAGAHSWTATMSAEMEETADKLLDLERKLQLAIDERRYELYLQNQKKK
jgi:hypothetical protein